MPHRDRLRELLENQNIKAFLRAIRLGEGTSDDLGYHRLVGGGEFDSFDQHPRVRVFIKRYNVISTAAGAYQIIWPTWHGLVDQYGFTDFSPETQDEAAVALISEKPGAIDAILAGRIVEAVNLCSMIWASLPGSTAGQRTEAMDNVLAEYERWGGFLDTRGGALV